MGQVGKKHILISPIRNTVIMTWIYYLMSGGKTEVTKANESVH